MSPRTLDLSALRALALTHQLGGLGYAAQRLGRTPSAVSLQLKRLQENVGVPLFRKEGRMLALTHAGEMVLSFAQQLLSLNDELLDTVRGSYLTGSVRMGISQDFAETLLPSVLAQFVKLYPQVMVEVRIEGNAALVAALEKSEVDLALVTGHARRGAATLGEIDLVWIADPNFRDLAERPLPLILFGPQCAFRQEAISKLDAIGRKWRVAAVSPSLAGLWAAASAGLGISARTRLGIPSSLISDRQLFDLPRLDPFPVTLHTRARLRSESVLRLRDMISDAAAQAISNS
jgi:DNA-binding transcriptional LysR family regulator